MRVIWVLAIVAIAACGDPPATTTAALGEIIGRVEIDLDVPQANCHVLVEGTPRGAKCNQDGEFSIRALDPGKWELRIISDDVSPIPARKITTAANAGLITDIGAVRIAKPGKIGGHVTIPPGTTAPFIVISVPRFGVATSPDPSNHGFLLERVPPGQFDVVLTTDAGAIVRSMVTVHPDETTTGIDFDLGGLMHPEVTVTGTALVAGSSDRSRIQIELVDLVNGAVKASGETGADGVYALVATQGVYLIRAHRTDRQAGAQLPFVAVATSDVAISTTLVIPADGDLDGDGTPDASDDDDDGDGTPDAMDAFPFDPADAVDTDGDGVGDNTDLDKDGDMDIDHAIATPDDDGDGLLDFEDNCEMTPNADQLNGDGDRFGNLCDNCPGLANSDQLDSDTDGIGDVCESCIAGSPCTPANACNIGLTSCAGNVITCVDTGAEVPAGQACGQDQVCFNHACGMCTNGETCFTSSAGACIVGVSSCATGMNQCLPTAAPRGDGTTCGTDMVCDSGACVGCVGGGDCDSIVECHVGALSCAIGFPQRCDDTGNFEDDGTPCGTSGNEFCLGGTCGVCVPNAACSIGLANECHLGTTSCATGSSVCTDTGMNAPNGQACTGVNMYCNSGSCVTSPNRIIATGGQTQNGNVGQTLAMPISVQLLNGGGAGINGQTLTIGLPPGALLLTAPSTTAGAGASAGSSSFRVRLGPDAGTQTFVVQSGIAPPLSIPITASAVPSGQSFSVVNASHVGALTGIPGPAVQAQVQSPTQLALGSDGSLYIAEISYHRILRVDANSQITMFAGGGTNPGDNIPATQASLYNPHSPVVDGNFLYFADTSNNVVRRVDLTTRVITRVAGGGNATAPTWGDGGSATSATLSTPTAVARHGNQTYILDSGHDRLRVVDATGKISTLYTIKPCAPGSEVEFVDFNEGALVIDPAGHVFISGDICRPGTSYTPGIARLERDGTLDWIGGNLSGSSGSGADAHATLLGQIHAMTFDTGGNLVVADYGRHRVRRIDSESGIVTNIAGTGASGDTPEYASAATAPLDQPGGVVFDGADLLVGQQGNSTITRIAAADRSTHATLSLSVGSATTSREVYRLSDLVEAELLSSGAPLVGQRIEWTQSEPQSYLTADVSMTNGVGRAPVYVRAGLIPGNYHFVARYRTLHGDDVTGSPATFTLAGTAPATGTIFTVGNLGHTGTGGFPAYGLDARPSDVVAIAPTSDGGYYFAESDRIYKVSPDGYMTVAVGTGSANPAGDYGSLANAGLYGIYDLVLDEPNQLLYISEYGGNRIRVADLANDVILPLAGGGSVSTAPFGDGGPASLANIGYVEGITLGGPGDHALYLYDSSHHAYRRVALDSPYTITTIVDANNNCSTGTVIYNASASGALERIGNRLLMAATICVGAGPPIVGIAAYDLTTQTLSLVAGSTGAVANNVPATSSAFSPVSQIVTDGAGGYYVIEPTPGRVRRISSSNIVTQVTGNGAGDAGDYAPPNDPSVRLEDSTAIGRLISGHIIYGSYYDIRMIW